MYGRNKNCTGKKKDLIVNLLRKADSGVQHRPARIRKFARVVVSTEAVHELFHDQYNAAQCARISSRMYDLLAAELKHRLEQCSRAWVRKFVDFIRHNLAFYWPHMWDLVSLVVESSKFIFFIHFISNYMYTYIYIRVYKNYILHYRERLWRIIYWEKKYAQRVVFYIDIRKCFKWHMCVRFYDSRYSK